MVKLKATVPWLANDTVDLDAWLESLALKGYTSSLSVLRQVGHLIQTASHDYAIETGITCIHHGVLMVDVLSDLKVDEESLVAALIFVGVHYAELSFDDLTLYGGQNIAKLVSGVEKMSAVAWLTRADPTLERTTLHDPIRKMLLAMVDDVRVVVIKLCDRLCTLRTLNLAPQPLVQRMAHEAMQIYAPLAHRLGLGSIKWEMEDLAFRYLQPEAYLNIAKSLNSKRLERDRYVNLIVQELNDCLRAQHIEHFTVSGRSKHLYSIYRKMLKKNRPLTQIYDATAVRILVDDPKQCYDVLGVIDSLWRQIPQEFDDYISQPKSNGYQSLHLAVEGPENRVFEVQIRTYAMHQQADFGVAAHWKYKEVDHQHTMGHDRKIDWLRHVLAWHHDVSTGGSSPVPTQSMEPDDRVYVFTKNLDILDLPCGATALDFAYQIHSDVGHRCRGAKVNGHIVPLTYSLKTGDSVEIMTGKEARPSRDWINPHLNYLYSSRARSRVLQWFKMQDQEKYRAQGCDLLEKELKSLGLKTDRLSELLPAFHLKTLDDLYVDVGSGDIKLTQITQRLTQKSKSELLLSTLIKKPSKKTHRQADVFIEGVGRLLTTMARCCQPVPGDEILGYITLGRGISVHRQQCANIVQASERVRERFVAVSWGSSPSSVYAIDLMIQAEDRASLLNDLTGVLKSLKVNLVSLNTQMDREHHHVQMLLTIEINGLSQLSHVVQHLKQVPNVLSIRRY